MSYVDIWTVYRRKLLCEILWIGAGCGRVMQTRTFGVPANWDLTRHSGLIRLAVLIGGWMTSGWQQSPLRSLRRIRWRFFFRRLLTSATSAPAPAPKPEPPGVEQLLRRLLVETQARQPAPAAAAASTGLETLIRNLLSGNLAPVQQPRPGPIRRDWNTVVCFSCGKVGHSVTRCPTLDESFSFMFPGWTAEKTGGGYILISPRVAAERRWAGNGDWSGGGGGGCSTVRSPPPPRDGVAMRPGARPWRTR